MRLSCTTRREVYCQSSPSGVLTLSHIKELERKVQKSRVGGPRVWSRIWRCSPSYFGSLLTISKTNFSLVKGWRKSSRRVPWVDKIHEILCKQLWDEIRGPDL